jgi:flagellar motor switch protein FliN/FliY
MRIELGSCGLDRDEACRLARGAVVPLTEALHEPLAVYADDRLFARGELVLLEGKFCVRVSELVVSSGCSDA